ncbi:MAG TPA: ferritin-like domain-containing protein [Thermoleophilaceae bacterium]|nr:ferritin-like domain-containing protein [Thermoleophilaceae bacterium]
MVEERNPSALEKLRGDPSSRKAFLRTLGGGAAAASLTLALAACGKEKAGGNEVGGAGVATAAYGQGDAGIVNFALALEYLESDFYKQAVASGNLDGRALELAKRFGGQEDDHVTTLEGTVRNLGGTPAPRPKASFDLSSRENILITMDQLEGLGAGAYLGQADRIESKEILAAALSIHSVEARHAAVVSMMLGRPISPDGAFARPITSVDVLTQIRPFVTA